MPKLVAGVFATRQDVILSITELHEHGFSNESLSVVTKDNQEMNKIIEDTGMKRAQGGDAQDSVFGVLKGLNEVLEGARGRALASGSASRQLGGADLWQNSDELVVPLVGAGIPKPDAQQYQAHVAKGNFLLLVESDEEQAKDVSDIMEKHQNIRID